MDESVRARTGLNSPYLSCGLAEQKRRERRPHHAGGPRAENHGGEDTRVARPRGASPRSKRLVGHPPFSGRRQLDNVREGGRSRPGQNPEAAHGIRLPPRPQRKAAETGAVAVQFPQNREPSLVPGLLQSRFALWLRYFWWAARPRAGRRGGGPGPDPDVDVDATRFDSSPARRPPRHSFSFLLRGLRLFFFFPCLSYSCYVIPMQETCADEESIVSGSSPFQETVLYCTGYGGVDCSRVTRELLLTIAYGSPEPIFGGVWSHPAKI